MHGRKRGGRQEERNTRARAKHDRKHAKSARQERERTRGAAGRGVEMCVRGDDFRRLADQRRFQAFLLFSKGYISMDFLEPGLRSLIHNLLKLRHRFCVVAYQELSSDFF